eukprot:552800-Pyramimonas_sp.AAC.1
MATKLFTQVEVLTPQSDNSEPVARVDADHPEGSTATARVENPAWGDDALLRIRPKVQIASVQCGHST